jgi:magnesium transporter
VTDDAAVDAAPATTSESGGHAAPTQEAGAGGADSLAEATQSSGEATGSSHDQGSKDAPKSHKKVPGSVTVARSQVYQVITISSKGDTSYDVVQRRRLLNDTGLRPRDLRRIDPTMTSYNSSPAMLIRDTVVLLNLGSIRAIVASTYCYLFQPSSNDAQYFMDVITSRLQTSSKMAAEDIPISFGVEVIEAALLAVTGQLDAELMSVTPKVDALLKALPGRITPEALDTLRQVKQQLVNFESRVDAFKELLEDLLEEEEDIRQISIVTRGGEDSDAAAKLQDASSSDDVVNAVLEMEEEEEEVEMLLEYYLMRLEGLHNEAERMLEAARETEDSIALTLSNRRFEINRLELILSIAALPVAIGALVSGIFGMNLQSTLELSVVAFYLCTGLIVVGAVAVFWAIYSWAVRRRIL